MRQMTSVLISRRCGKLSPSTPLFDPSFALILKTGGTQVKSEPKPAFAFNGRGM
jgi:hypothetical protein